MATTSQMPGLSAAADLGLGGLLTEQVAGETEEERKRRMAQIKASQQMGPSGSLAVTSLLGMSAGARGAGY